MSGVAVCAHGGCLVCVVELGCPCAIGERGATLCYLGYVSMQKGLGNWRALVNNFTTGLSVCNDTLDIFLSLSVSLSLSPLSPPVIGGMDGWPAKVLVLTRKEDRRAISFLCEH